MQNSCPPATLHKASRRLNQILLSMEGASMASPPTESGTCLCLRSPRSSSHHFSRTLTRVPSHTSTPSRTQLLSQPHSRFPWFVFAREQRGGEGPQAGPLLLPVRPPDCLPDPPRCQTLHPCTAQPPASDHCASFDGSGSREMFSLTLRSLGCACRG